MRWQKLGLIFRVKENSSWMVSHAQLPVFAGERNGLWWILFATRDRSQRSHIGWVELEPGGRKIARVGTRPLLTPGPKGFFDQDGVFPSCVVPIGDKIFLYYIGWTRLEPAPLFLAAIGLAVSEDGGKNFQRYSAGPILARSPYDPCLVTSPWVIHEEHNHRWSMWYVSGIGWSEIDGKLYSQYHIKFATSKDGINWERRGLVAIDFKEPSETNIARPCVLYSGGKYEMWFCRGGPRQPYIMGYASSNDGIHWERCDKLAGITPSPNGFDSKMTAYPCVFKYKRTKYMLYNGNDYGKEGFGLAEEVPD